MDFKQDQKPLIYFKICAYHYRELVWNLKTNPESERKIKKKPRYQSDLCRYMISSPWKENKKQNSELITEVHSVALFYSTILQAKQLPSSKDQLCLFVRVHQAIGKHQALTLLMILCYTCSQGLA